MQNALLVSRFMDTPDRLGAAFLLLSRARRYAAACTTTSDLLDALDIVKWAERHHAAIAQE